MAIYTWTGTTDGDWEKQTNWSPNDAGFPDGVTDEAIFSSGAVDCTILATPRTIRALRIGSEYTGKVAKTSTPMGVSGTTLDFSGGGVGHNIDGTWTNVDVNDSSRSSADALTLTDSNITNLSILGGSGNISVLGTSVVTTIVFVNATSSKLTLGISGTEVTGIANITIESGEIVKFGDVSVEIQVLGGSLSDRSGTSLLTNIYDGTVFHNSSDTTTSVVVYGGEFDGTVNTTSGCTITNMTIYEGGEINLMSGLENYTLTNGIIFNGGVFTPDRGTTWTFS